MPIGGAVLWLAAWLARSGAAIHGQPVWSEHVDVSARIVPAAMRAAHLGDGGALSASSLSAAGPDLARWSALSARATGTRAATTVRVDGVEGGALPPSGAVASAALATDPFSAAAASADDIVLDLTTAPRTRWSLTGTPGAATARARDPLSGGPAPRSSVRSISAGGPVGHSERTSVWFSASSTSTTDDPTYADPVGAMHVAATHDYASNSWSAGLTRSFARFQIAVTGGAASSRDGSAGVGGEQGPNGALALGSRNAFSRASLSGRIGSWTIHGATSIEARRDSVDAVASGRAMVFASLLTSGAPDVVSRQSNATAFRVRVTASATAGAWAGWLAGVDASRDAIDDRRVFNPDGVLILASPIASTGLLITHGSAAAASVRRSAMAVFAERVAVDREHLWLRSGARLTQTSSGTTFDPRLTLGVNAGVLLFGASAGLYTAPWPISVEVERQFQHAADERIVDPAGRALTARIAGAGQDRRDGVVRVGVGHSGRLTTEVDQTWRAGWRLAGLTRAIDAGTIVDTLDSDRQRRERDTHASISFAAHEWTVAAHYTFASASDNTDGPLSFGPDPSAIAPWAPAARVPRHLASVVASGSIGRGVRLLISAQAESGLAYSLANGTDPAGLFTFSGLDGGRHAYRAAGTRDLSAYFARVITLRRWGVSADTGLRLENVFNSLSPTAIAQTSGSSRAGRAVSAAPGRSVSFWATFGWR